MLEMVHLFTFVLTIVREFYEYSSMNWLGSSVNMRECVAVLCMHVPLNVSPITSLTLFDTHQHFQVL